MDGLCLTEEVEEEAMVELVDGQKVARSLIWMSTAGRGYEANNASGACISSQERTSGDSCQGGERERWLWNKA